MIRQRNCRDKERGVVWGGVSIRGPKVTREHPIDDMPG